MGLELVDLIWRIERVFQVKIAPADLQKLADRNVPPDVLVGDLFDLVRREAFRTGVLDEELDGETSLWHRFQQVISDALGVEIVEISRDRGIVRDLGA